NESPSNTTSARVKLCRGLRRPISSKDTSNCSPASFPPPISLRNVGVIPCIPYVMSSSHHRYRGTGQQQTQRDLCDPNANEPGHHQHSEPKDPSRPLRP